MDYFKVEIGACRLCLEKAVECVALGSFKHDGMSIEEILFSVSGFKVQQEDPKNICQSCWEQLLSCFQFLKKIRETESKLRQFVRMKIKQEQEEPISDIDADAFPEDPFQPKCELMVDQLNTSTKSHPEESEESQSLFEWLRTRGISVTKKKNKSRKKTSNTSAPAVSIRRTKVKSTDLDRDNKEIIERKISARSCDFCWEEYPGQPCQCPAVKRSPKKVKTEETCPAPAKSKKKESKYSDVGTGKRRFPNYSSICHICGAILNNPGAWWNHIDTHQALQKGIKLVCDICGKFSLNKTLLRHHMRTHIDLNLACEQCGKRFRTNHRYKVHLKTHTTERNFVCRFNCGLAFKTSKTQRNHEKIHREYEYICPIEECRAGFNISSSLRQHVERHHPHYKLPPKGTILSQKYMKDGRAYFYHENLAVANQM